MARRRRRGEGSVFYDETEAVWVARVSLGVVNGRRIRHKVTAPTPERARLELDRLRRAYGSGSDPARMTLDAYLHHWLRGHGPSVRASTLVSYTGHVEHHICPLLGGIIVARLRPADVRRLIADRLAAGLSPATVGRLVTTLRIALAEACRERALTDNAAAAVRLPRIEPEPIRALGADDVRAIRSAIAGAPLGPLYLFLLGSGLRLGEAVALDWRDVDLVALTVSVRRGKTARAVRTVGITTYAGEALRSIGPRDPAQPVFTGPRTRSRLSGWTASHNFPRLLSRAGLAPLRVHDLRHAHASRMLAHGIPMRVIADQLGHANPALTARVYAHVLPEAQRAAVATLDADLAPIGSGIGSAEP